MTTIMAPPIQQQPHQIAPEEEEEDEFFHPQRPQSMPSLIVEEEEEEDDDEHDEVSDDEEQQRPLPQNSKSSLLSYHRSINWNLGEEQKKPFAKFASNWAVHEIRTLCDEPLAGALAAADSSRIPLFDPSQVTVQGTLGQGGFSTVLKVSVHSNENDQQPQQQTLALKRLRSNHSRTHSENDLIKHAADLTREIRFLSRLDHEHIIQIQGVCTGTVSESFVGGKPGYFFLMPVLEETLSQRLERWRKADKAVRRGSGGLFSTMLFRRKARRASSTGTISSKTVSENKPTKSKSAPQVRRRPSLVRRPSLTDRMFGRSSFCSDASPNVSERRPSLTNLLLLGRSASPRTTVTATVVTEEERSALSAPFSPSPPLASTPAPPPLTPPPCLTERLKQVALPIAKGMLYLHDKNILWRDLKPANIGFDANGCLKLFDFGLSRQMNDENLKRCNFDIAGTYAYMAPETVQAIRATSESDVYSFGVLLWELATLQKPFPKSLRTNKTKFKEKVVLGGWRPSLASIESRALRRLIEVCWGVRPRSRPSFHRIWFLLVQLIGSMERQALEEQEKAGGFFKNKNNSRTTTATNSKPPLGDLSDCTAETEPCASTAEGCGTD